MTARRPWGAALVTAGPAGAALLLALLFHLGVAAAAAILATCEASSECQCQASWDCQCHRGRRAGAGAELGGAGRRDPPGRLPAAS
jgi:hypothetical protein